MTTLVISNANARRSRAGLALIERLPRIVHEVSTDVAEVAELLRHYQPGPDDLVVAHGGDGTVQQLVTVLLNMRAADEMPRLAVLPGGTTNMTASDLNTSHSIRGCIDGLAKRTEMPLVTRRIIRVRCGEREIYGFFFGLGAIVHGIRYFEHRRRQGTTSSWFAAARAVWGVLRAESPYGSPLDVEIDGQNETVLLLLISTLGRLIFGVRPFWCSDVDGLKMTRVEYGAPRLISSLSRAVRGRPPRAAGYHSDCIEQVRLKFVDEFTLDGELFDTGDLALEIGFESLRMVPL